MFNIFKKRDEKKIDKVVERSSKHSHDILNEVQKDIAKMQNGMRKSKQKHIKELDNFDTQLSDISRKIAKVTGGFDGQ